jgi:membrane-bound lytic murein transglycosylase D
MSPARRQNGWRGCAALLSALIAWGGAPAAARAAESAIPRPPAIEREVQFWIRVYTEVTTDEGFLHDENNLGVVYEKLRFPPNSTPREREALVGAARDRYVAALKRIALAAENAAGVPSVADQPPVPPAAPGTESLSAEDRRVRDLWGRDATPQRLLAATNTMRFQLGQADRFRAGLVRSAAWESHIADALANLGLPPEIAALPHVESSFNPAAYSKVGAAGLWQFMRSTGRRYLRIDSAVDERLDPFRSSEAAAQLLAYNYRILGSWPLAITAYNHGAAGMRRARDALGTDDIVAIVRNFKGATFGFASRNFYVSFLAALTIEQNPEKYFGALERVPEQHFREVAVPAYVPVRALERALPDIDRETLRVLNPALLRPVWEGQRYVPRGYLLRMPLRAGEWTTEKLAARLSPTDQYVGQIESRAHVVRRGDTLQRVAVRYGLRTQLLADLNGLAEDAKLRPGRTLRLPERRPAHIGSAAIVVAAAGVADAGGAAAAADSPDRSPETAAVRPTLYVVRRGEALSDIATRVGVRQADLIRFNRLRDSDFIFEGQKLRLVPDTSAPPAATEIAAVAAAAATDAAAGVAETLAKAGVPVPASGPPRRVALARTSPSA